MILPAVTNDLLIARNRFWEQERAEITRANICYEDMAYRGTPCVCGQHDQDPAIPPEMNDEEA